MVQLADRVQEFAPVKNRNGVDSIATSRVALSERAKDWVRTAGVPGLSEDPNLPLEIQAGLCLGPKDLEHGCAQLAWKVPERLLGLR